MNSIFIRKTKICFFAVTICVLLLIIFHNHIFEMTDNTTGYLTGTPGNTSLGFAGYSQLIKGWDKDGTTIFFTPSFISLEKISQMDLTYIMYDEHGHTLSNPRLSQTQDVYILNGEDRIPWKVAFYGSSNLSTVFIDINDGDEKDIDHDEYKDARISVYTNDGNPECEEKEILIKGRGNSTWEAEKKPFEIKLNEALSICEMEPSDKWVLLANYYDDTKMLNKMVFDMAKRTGMEYTIDSDWVDLYINGYYYGNYLVCREPSLKDNRIGIENLAKDNEPFFDPAKKIDDVSMRGYEYDMIPRNISGGYLFEKNWTAEFPNKETGFFADGYCFTIKSPDNAALEEVEYIRAVTEETAEDIENGDISSIDMDSFCRRFILDEYVYNVDSMRTSYYFYKKQNEGRIYAGPCWDYDLACGRVKESDFNDYTGSLLNQKQADIKDEILDWDEKLMDISEYREYAGEVFLQMKPVLENVYLEDINKYESKIRASVTMDYVRWSGDNNPYFLGYYENLENKYRYIRFFLNRRLMHLSEFFGQSEGVSRIDLAGNGTHTIIFDRENGESEEWQVKDGEQVEPDKLPACDAGYKGWKYTRCGAPFSYYVPVYEDLELTQY